MFEADASVMAFLHKIYLSHKVKSYIWLGESREWTRVTWAVVERGSMKMGWRGEEGKERLQEKEDVVEEEGEEEVEEREKIAVEFPLQSAR